MSCGAPQADAPDLITLDDEVGCYFHKQPETSAEVDDAVRALLVSCVEAYRYGGSDPTVRRRLAQLGYQHLCDHPLEGQAVVLRNQVRFSLGERGQAADVAMLLVSWFETAWKDGSCTTPVVGDAHRAVFEYAPSRADGRARRYTLEHVATPALVGPSSVYRDPSTLQVWHFAEVDGTYPPIWLHELLVKNGALNVRWFSRDEWATQSAGEALPY